MPTKKIDRHAAHARSAELARLAIEALETTARAFAKGRATSEELQLAARKATNAVHAVGRTAKAVAS